MQASLNTLTYTFYRSNLGGPSCSNICLFRDTFDDAEYFTYVMMGRDENKCHCKPDMDLEKTWKGKKNRVSGNVKCDESEYIETFNNGS